MTLLRIYLLVGLLTHKLVWEVLKHGQNRVGAPEHPRSIRVRLIKAVKVGILLGIVVQTLGLDVLPLTSEPFMLRLVGVVVYTVGLLVAIMGRIQLGNNWSDIETAQVLHKQVVISNGLYRYTRHPIYTGDLLLLCGLELSLNSWLVVAVALLAPVVLWQAVREERMLMQTLPGYETYCARTKRFMPFVV